ncbi:hypothetical protein V501_00373, partial [Pseudogymnoascus sp. VKM F-4519 (FW-2642)]
EASLHPLPPPSQSWLNKYIQKELLEFHFITTKPIAQQRTQAQDEPTIITWFEKYMEIILQHSINQESIWNMDETGFRIGIPGGERVMVPRAVKQLYTPSPKNRTSITIIEAVSAARQNIAPVLVVPGKIHMEAWYPKNLNGNELMMLSETGFSNSQLAIQWLQHFIEHTAPHNPGFPKLLLLDSHGVEQGLQQWKERVPQAFSSPSRQSYSNWVTGAERVLATAQLQELDLQAVRLQAENSKKKRGGRRRGRLQCGGELRASEAYELQAQKAELEAQKLAAIEARKLRQAENQARNQLKKAATEARKLSQAQKRAQNQLKKAGIKARLPIPIELEDPITGPEANTESEYESATEGRSSSERERENGEVIIL